MPEGVPLPFNVWILNEEINQIFSISSPTDFNEKALEIFRMQYREVEIYRSYCDLINIDPGSIRHFTSIPFLPISFFRNYKVLRANHQEEMIFKSSGTSDMKWRSKHSISDLDIYLKSLLKGFEIAVGPCENFTFLSLLPNYEENAESSLIYMVHSLGKHSKEGKVRSFSSVEEAAIALKSNLGSEENFVLFGVSFALLDLAEKMDANLSNVIVVETGGMKGRRKEIVRSELQEIIRARLKPRKIISEYGMTELLSQAYAIDGEYFSCPPWMKVLVRDTNDPFSVHDRGSGAMNVIDLANMHSSSFIATEDLGMLQSNGTFRVLGRFDHSDIRGCNLLYAEDMQ